jgi:hypothetical protein
MTPPDHVSPQSPDLATAPAPSASAAVAVAGPPAPASVLWRRAALLLSLAAQLITVSALTSADPIAATWAALLMATAPAPLAAVAVFGPARVRMPALLAAAVVLVVGIVGNITHTGVFFVPALAALLGAAVTLWRQRS